MKTLFFLLVLASASPAIAQTKAANKSPFEGLNTTWINGQSRQASTPLTFADSSRNMIIAATAYVDSYYCYSFNGPKDNTIVGSATIGRHNELTMNLISIGMESTYQNSTCRIWLQSGNSLALIQETDGSLLHGKNQSIGAMEHIREAAAGYHFNLLHGVNLEAGIFGSFIGMDSYLTQENWSYQRAMVNDFVPSYFTGVRLQAFPSWRYKTELWLVNGWQSYGKFGKASGVGSANLWRPCENLQLYASFYFGTDNRSSDFRFHHDNSIAYRYYVNPNASGISQCAFAVNCHAGFEDSKGVNNLLGLAIMNRIWLCKNVIGLTYRYDCLSNKGLYLVGSPSSVVPNSFTESINSSQSPKLTLQQHTITFDYLPNSSTTFRVELGYRRSNLPFFAGRQGTTSPDGWSDTPTTGWTPSLKKQECRLILSLGVRI